jgi:hypothetical protein
MTIRNIVRIQSFAKFSLKIPLAPFWKGGFALF